MTDSSRFGGRVEAMRRACALADDAGLRAPAMAALSADDLLPFDLSERPDEPGSDSPPRKVSADIKGRWKGAGRALRDAARKLDSQPKGEFTQLILKTSYLANTDSDRLSFAGIGRSIVCENRAPSSLGRAIGRLLRARYRGLPVYYRRAHGMLDAVDIGVLAVENFQNKKFWCSVWAGPGGFVCRVSTEHSDPSLHETFLIRAGENHTAAGPDWARGPAVNRLSETVLAWCKNGAAGRYFDLEFSISTGDELALMQWRPIPAPSAKLLDANLAADDPRLISPYGSTMSIKGERIEANALPRDQDSLAERIAVSSDEIWALPYRSGSEGVDLFQALTAVHTQPELRLPPIVALHAENGSLSHLHALLPEDPRVGPVWHRLVAG